MLRSSALLLCFAGSALSVWSTQCLRPPISGAAPDMKLRMQHFGRLIFLTVQTNIINTAYFGLCLCASLLDSELELAVTACFPLSFALGSLLTPLYYGLDHFNPEKRRRNKLDIEKGFVYVDIADHLEHGLALPVVLLHATVVGKPPDAHTTGLLIGVYATSYLALTVLNHSLTGLWTYPVIDDIERKSGSVGVLVFLGVVTGVMVGLAFVGSALADISS